MPRLIVFAGAGVLLVAACASRAAQTQPGGSETTAPAQAVVPWVDRSAPAQVAATPTPTTYPTDAPPCRAADLTAAPGVVGAAGGRTNLRVEFTNNTDNSVCVLLGYPTVAGVSADGTATSLDTGHGSITGEAPWPAANINPGQRAAVNISGASGCDAAQRGEALVYPTLRIGLPSGDFIDVASHRFDTVCGVEVSRFGVPAYAEPGDEPVSPLTAQMTGPATAHPGENLAYTVVLRNGSDSAYQLTPCPSYEEYVAIYSGGIVRPNYYLNCDTVREIPAHGAVTYEMRLQLPADLGSGQAKFGWYLVGGAGPYAAAAEQLQITD